MVEKASVFDLVVDEILERQRLVRAELKARFKRTKPFRTEPVSREEKLLEYDEFTPEIEDFSRSNFGNEAVDIYKNTMEELRGKE